jgi:hypothetical protein
MGCKNYGEGKYIMTKFNTTNSTQKLLISSIIIFILLIVIILPLFSNIHPSEPENPIEPPVNPPISSKVAGEPNLTRIGYPFILKNYPEFKWKSANESDPGPEAFPNMFSLAKGLIGLNASNIRIAFYDADYNWQIVPFQIDNVGWPNIWQINDLDYFGGVDAGLGGTLGVGGAEGLGSLYGSSTTNDYSQTISAIGAAPFKFAWYPTPIHTHVTTKQPDGSYTSEDVNIDPNLRSHLIWSYINDPQLMGYGGYNEPWIYSINGTSSGLVYMGDTWFQTPSQINTGNPNWYDQIDGFIDKDDEISFYAENGRKVPNYIWWNYSYFPYRFEVQIVDPVDGGRSWMYIYYNNQSNYNFYTNGSAANLGNPKSVYTTQIKDYYLGIQVHYPFQRIFINYQLSINKSNPTLIDSLKITKDGSDGQNIINELGKNYGYGYYEDKLVGAISGVTTAGRDGYWFDYTSGTKNSFNELITVLDNPAIWYDPLYYDISDPDRSNDSSPYYYDPPEAIYETFVSMGKTPPPNFGDDPLIDDWEENFGDNHVIVDGAIRIIQYISKYYACCWFVHDGGNVVGPESWLVTYLPIFDGPVYYYRNMQEYSTLNNMIPYIDELSIEYYYNYIECGHIDNNIRDDMTIYAGQEWNGTNAPDGIDQSGGFGYPADFNYSEQYGWTKYGGLNPKITSYSLLGTCITDGNGGAGGGDGDFYYSGNSTNIMSDPLLNDHTEAAKPSPNNGHNIAGNVPDWLIFDSESHGGFWQYIP